MTKTLIATATYNEAENIKILVNKIVKVDKKSKILIIDDNSSDGTSGIVLNLKKKNKNLSLIIRKKRLGLDTAHKLIFDYAKKNNVKYLITLDADLSHDPKEIPNFLKAIKKHDFVIGSRYIRDGECNLTGYRYFISKYGNKFIKYFLNLEINEFTTSFRCFDMHSLKKFNFNKINAKGYSFFMKTVCDIVKNGHKYKEIPIKFNERNKGVSKIPKIELFRTLINVFLIKLNHK